LENATCVRIGAAVVLAGAVMIVFTERQALCSTVNLSPSVLSPSTKSAAAGSSLARFAPSITPTRTVLAPEATAMIVGRINRDYDAITLATLAQTTAHREAGGDAHVFAQQLDLLERERRKDLAALLTSRELEELERRESPAGRLVAQLLGGTHATEEQRREVFRRQRAFEIEFDGDCPPSTEAALEMERAWQRTQEQIHTVLGDDLFGSWAVGGGELHAAAREFASHHGLPPHFATELRKAQYDYRLNTSALRATNNLPPHQREAAKNVLKRQSEARVMTLLGPALYQVARKDLLSWLPQD
jgi:hypothetical protein